MTVEEQTARLAALPQGARDAIAELVAGWPPFTAEQRATLARLLNTGARGVPARADLPHAA